MATSDLEFAFECQLKMARFPIAEREYKFHPDRRFRFDFAWPDYKISLETEGGVFSGGRHTRGTGFTSDCVKYNLAAIAGWLVLRVTGNMVKNGEALQFLEQALKSRGCQLPKT